MIGRQSAVNPVPGVAPTQPSGTNRPTETLPGGFFAVWSDTSEPHRDSRFGGDYTNIARLYVVSQKRKPTRPRCVLRVHYNSDDQRLAERTLRLCARLLHLHRTHFQREARFPRAADCAELYVNTPSQNTIWGGETWTHHVFIFRAQPERTALEWVRTVVHEWGHLTLPAARGFQEPETDAAGYLGERLYLKWLYEETMYPRFVTPDDGTTRADLTTYHARQVAPLIAQFQKSGPQKTRLSRKDATGMDEYIAFVLACDTAFGSARVGQALFTINSVEPADILRTMTDAVSYAVGIKLPAWVPLKPGGYQVTGDTAGKVAIADRPPIAVSEVPVALSVRTAGWKWVRRVSGDISAITLQRKGKP